MSAATPKHRRRACAAVLALLAGLLPGAQAALITLPGTQFDLSYDDTKLGLFGTPSLSGNTIFFTFSGFVAESLNGQGLVTKNSTVNGLVLTAHDGFHFGGFNLTEFGDYKLSGANSFVRVEGQLRAFDIAAPTDTQTTSFLQAAPGTNLNLDDGGLHDWAATAAMDGNTPPAFGFTTNVLAGRPTQVGLAVENLLTAYTEAQDSGPKQAFIEKKFAGTGVQVTVSPVPLPLPSTLMLAALGAGWLVRRRLVR